MELISWESFLLQMQDALPLLEQRQAQAKAEEAQPVVAVSFDTAIQGAQAWIGVGDWNHRSEGYLCLNNKGAGLMLQPVRYFQSVSDLVLSDHEAFRPRWSQALGSYASPAEFFTHFQLVVEDASPDSCFGLVVFLALLNGVPSVRSLCNGRLTSIAGNKVM